MNRNLLRDSVAEKLESITGRNFNQSEINSFNSEKNPSKTKPTTFEQLSAYLKEKHKKEKEIEQRVETVVQNKQIIGHQEENQLMF